MSSNIEVMRICEECKSEFTAKTTITRFCSHTCNRRYYKKQQRLKKVEASNIQTFSTARELDPVTAKDYLTIKEVCNYIGISRTTLWRLVKNHTIQAIKLGDRTIINKSYLERVLKPL